MSISRASRRILINKCGRQAEFAEGETVSPEAKWKENVMQVFLIVLAVLAVLFCALCAGFAIFITHGHRQTLDYAWNW